jgi:type VI secretion system protein ImpH
MGLCGSASPLPPFYAQQIVEDAHRDDGSCRILFDLISLPSYRNHAIAYFHNKLAYRLMEKNERSSRDLLLSLMGQAHQALLPKNYSQGGDLAYLSLFSTQTRSAQGLLFYLRGLLRQSDVDLEQCVLRWVPVATQQRCRLGGSNRESRTLGLGAVLGRRCRDRNGKFRLRVKVDKPERLDELSPGAEIRKQLEAAVDLYLTSPLVYDLKITLAPGLAQGVRLGGKPSQGLGLSTFLSPPADTELTLCSQPSDHRGPPRGCPAP